MAEPSGFKVVNSMVGACGLMVADTTPEACGLMAVQSMAGACGHAAAHNIRSDANLLQANPQAWGSCDHSHIRTDRANLLSQNALHIIVLWIPVQ